METVKVLDASVLGKWFFPEESEADIAGRIKDEIEKREYDCYIPSFALLEISNALFCRMDFHHGNFVKITREIDQKIIRSKIRIEPLDFDLIKQALTVCETVGIVVYDAYYLALANRENGVLITADYKASKKMLTRYKNVIELANY